MQKKGIYILIGLLSATLFAGCVLARNYFLWDQYCWSNYDIGIFTEMIQKNAQGILNPYLNVRQIGQFNDHFTVIVSLLSPLNHFLANPHLLFWIEVSFLLLTLIFLAWEVARKRLTPELFALFSCFIFLNRDLFEAGYFAVHPATWGVPFLTLWGIKALQLKKTAEHLDWRNLFPIYFCYIVLCLMDEQFSFAGIGFGIGLLIATRLRVTGLLFTLFSLFMVWLAHSGRRLAFGPLMPYYKQRMTATLADILERYPVSIDMGKTFVLHFVGLAPFIYLLRKGFLKNLKQEWRTLILIGGIFGPLLLGRAISNSFGFHYSTAVVVFWAVAFLALCLRSELTKKFVLISCAFFLVIGVSKIKKAFTAPMFLNGMNCLRRDTPREEFEARKVRLDRAFDFLAQQVGDRPFKIMAQSNLGPNILARFPNAEVFNLGVYHVTNTDSFDWFFTENGQGEIIYVPSDRFPVLIGEIKQIPETNVLIEEPGVFLAKGKFPARFFDSYSTQQMEHE